MTAPKAEDIKRGIAVIWENLQCPICLELMNAPVSTKCDHQFCKFCLMKLLERSKRKETSCPVCKMKVTKRSLKESPGFQRLVEGLQSLVQSYEFDTCSSYFTGRPQHRGETSVDSESRGQQCSEGRAFSGNDVTEKSASHSSSAAVKDAFAELMGLADSCTVSSGDPGNKTGELEDIPSTTEDRLSNLLTHNNSGSDGKTDIHKKQSSRRSKRVGLEPDRIADKRQKKSVEKVAEWLLRISPSSRTPTRDDSRVSAFPTESDSERESRCSSSSKEGNLKCGDKDDGSPPKEVPGRGLEEKVFGAVYKREHRGVRTVVNRAVSPEKEIVTNPVPFNLREEEKVIKGKGPKRKRSCRLTPADFIRKSSSAIDQKEVEESKDSVIHTAVDHNVELNSEEQMKHSVEECKKVSENSADEKCDYMVANMEESPVFEVPMKRPGRRSKSKMQDVWQSVDLYLKEKENICENRTSRKRRGKDGHLAESKSAKCTKFLTLVDAAGNEDVDVVEQLKNKHKIVKAEINIESYPSSEDPRSPDARKTRRSLRLRAFTTEIQGTRKQRQPSKGALKPDSGPYTNPLNNPSQFSCLEQPNVDNMDANVYGDQDHASGHPSSGKTDLLVSKNGCVFNSDLGEIEAVQTNEEAATVPCVSEEQVLEQHSAISVIPDTVASVAATYACPSQAVHDALDSLVPEKSLGSPSTWVVSPSVVQTLRDAPYERGFIEQEGETNDSELDTELLMKSFKTTKRKSFYLGSPKPSPATDQERLLNKTDEEEKLQNQTHIPTIQKEPTSDPTSDLANVCHTDLPLFSNTSKLPLREEQSQRSQSSCGNAANAGISLLQTKASIATGSQKKAFLKNSGNSTSSGLSPNRVARSQDSKLLTNSDSVTSYQGLFASVTQVQSQICSSKVQNNESQKSPKLGACQPRTTEMSNEPIEGGGLDSSDKSPNLPAEGKPSFGVHSNNFESSITPDGLLPESVVPHECCQVTEPVSNQCLDEDKDAETPSQPCVPRKRRAQRLESSESELRVEDDLLPTLAHLLKSHRSPSRSGQEPLQKSEFSELDHQEPDPGLQFPGEPNIGNILSEATPEAQSSQLSQGVGPSQNHKCPDNATADTMAVQDDVHLPEPSSREEWITSSQGSVDLFGTPEESEAAGNCGNVAVSRDSSQYSSEIITTQQKEEMEQDLRRLERMMALVSEALQKKEMDTGSKTLDLSDSELQSGRRATRSHPKFQGSERRSSQKAEAGLAALDGSGMELTEGNEAKEAQRETPAAGMCRLGTSSTAGNMELVASGLSASELMFVKKFARKMHGHLSKEMTPSTTHVIIKTDEDLVCERTLKYFQGIAGRKWVVSYLWISECFNQGRVLDEAEFEVRGDVVNGHSHNGPLKSRTTAENELLMKGYEICFQGSFTAMTTDQMEAMVEMCGATVVKDPLMFSKDGKCQLVVVQPGCDDSQSYYRALQKKATVVSRSWLLDTIATYTFQNPGDYKP